jgi:WD40 repeat protein
MMDDDSRAHLETLRRSHLRRLQELEKQAAALGLSTPPHINTEIEDIRLLIAEIDRQLANAGARRMVPRAKATTLPVRPRSWWLRPVVGSAAILLVLIVALRMRDGSGGTAPNSIPITAQPTAGTQAQPMTTSMPAPTSGDNALRLIRTLPNSNGVASVALSANGQIVAIGFYDGTVRLWHVSDGLLLRTLTAGTGVGCVAFSSDSKTLATGLDNTTVKLWRVSDGTHLRTLEGLSFNVYSVAFSADGQTVAAGSLNDLKLWRVSDGMLLQNLEGHTSHVYSVAFSADGQTLASASSDDTVKLWQVSDGKPLQDLKANGFSSVAFSPNSQTLAAGGERTVYLWRVSDGELLHELRGHTDVVGSVAFSADGQTLVSGSNDIEVRRWQVSDGTRLYTLEETEAKVQFVQFAADGRTMVAVKGNMVQLWEVP